MAGGLGEGAIPLSLGYSILTSQPQPVLFAQIIPVVMLGSFTAVILSGLLNLLGKRFPHLTGEGPFYSQGRTQPWRARIPTPAPRPSIRWRWAAAW